MKETERIEGTENDRENLIVVRNLKKYFPVKSGFLKRTKGFVKAVDDISFTIRKGTTMGLVGESGCGKSTLGRTILRLQDKTEGEVYFSGKEIFSLSREELRRLRPRFQIIFQDPFSSLSPRLNAAELIGEAVKEHHIVESDEYDTYISHVMASCGLRESDRNRRPQSFSGGQRQRICIARALALQPDFIVCDEIVSSLDVSVQAQIINLLKDLQKKEGLTYLFISHDLSVVEQISDTVAVMYLGKIVEEAESGELFKNPLHPYTQALLSSVPVPDLDYKKPRIILDGTLPSLSDPPQGCAFHTRCRRCMEICRHVSPSFRKTGEDHYCACHLFNTGKWNSAES